MGAGVLLTVLAMFVVALTVVYRVVLAVLQIIVVLYPYSIRQEAVEVAKENEIVVNGFSQTRG